MSNEEGIRERLARNDFGVVGVTLGIVSLSLFLPLPFAGIISGVVGFIFSLKQKKVKRNKWSNAGIILNSISVALSIVILIAFFYLIENVTGGTEILTQIGDGVN